MSRTLKGLQFLLFQMSYLLVHTSTTKKVCVSDVCCWKLGARLQLVKDLSNACVKWLQHHVRFHFFIGTLQFYVFQTTFAGVTLVYFMA